MSQSPDPWEQTLTHPLDASPKSHRGLQRHKSRILRTPDHDDEPPPVPIHRTQQTIPNAESIVTSKDIEEFNDGFEDEEALPYSSPIPPLQLANPSDETLVFHAPSNMRSPMTGIFHSGEVRPEHFAYLRTLGLKTMICLDWDAYIVEVPHIAQREGIMFYVAAMLDGIIEPCEQDMALLMDVCLTKRKRPVLIYSKEGKHRVACVIGVLRRIVSDWPLSAILEEYRAIAHDDMMKSCVVKFIVEASVEQYGIRWKGSLDDLADPDGLDGRGGEEHRAAVAAEAGPPSPSDDLSGGWSGSMLEEDWVLGGTAGSSARGFL